MAGQLRVGIIGAGRIAELGHLPGFAGAGARIAALCDSSRPQAALRGLAAQYAVQRVYTDWRAMLADGELDAVSICTPPALHADMAVASLERGLHTLVEKPMALTLPDCDRMIAAERASGALLMVAHNQRFSARHVVAKAILDEGRLGRPYRVHAAFAHGGPENWSPDQRWYFDAGQARFGVLADLGCHKIDLLRWLLGEEVTEVGALSMTYEKPTLLDDTGVIMLRFSHGTLGTIQVSWAFRPGLDDSVTIFCQGGTLAVPSSAADPVRVLEHKAAGVQVDSRYSYSPDDPPGWAGAIAAFVAAAAAGGPSPVPGEEGRATMAAVLAAYEAIARKTMIAPGSLPAI